MESEVTRLKNLGNYYMIRGNFPAAVESYSKAIELDPNNYVLYSERSAAYLKMCDYTKALEDAKQTLILKPDWVKENSREDSTLASPGSSHKSACAYIDGLLRDPNNQVLKNGLQNSLSGNPFQCDYVSKLLADPRTCEFFKDPTYLTLLEDMKKEFPLSINDNLDLKVITTLQVLLQNSPAFEEFYFSDPDVSSFPMDQDHFPRNTSWTGNTQIRDIAPDFFSNKDMAMSEKCLGNDAYRKKEFTIALEHYKKAIGLYPIEITFYTNVAAVYFEQGEYEKCIQECETGIAIGRTNRADFKIIAKAFARIGNAYKRMNKLDSAKVFYEKSMSEHRTPEIKAILSDVEKKLKEIERNAYLDPKKAAAANQKGNDLFIKGDYAEAIKEYSEAIQRNPNEAKYFSNRAACYTKLAAFDLGLKDCDVCVQTDPSFIKGWIRKGKILQVMQETTRGIDAYLKALDIDPTNAEALEGYKQCSVALQNNPEEVRKRAMADPEVLTILSDPAMRVILEQMQNDPEALNDHLKNQIVAAKIQKLLDYGLLSIR